MKMPISVPKIATCGRLPAVHVRRIAATESVPATCYTSAHPYIYRAAGVSTAIEQKVALILLCQFAGIAHRRDAENAEALLAQLEAEQGS
jgi:hypothetical protein